MFHKVQNLLISLSLCLGSIITFGLVAEGVSLSLIDESEYVVDVSAKKEKEKGFRNVQNGLLYKNNQPNKDYYLKPNPDIGKESDKFRIALVGDSYTQGTGVKEREYEYDYQLQDMIDKDEDFSESEVIKFAGDPFNSFQELVLIRELVLDYNPDIIVLQFCPNDGQATRSHVGGVGGRDKYVFADTNYVIKNGKLMPSFSFLSHDTNKALIPHSSFLRFLSYKMNMGESVRKENLSLALDSIAKMEKITSKNNIPFLIVNFPSTRSERIFCNEETASGIKNKVADLSEKLSIPFHDLCHDLNPAEHDSQYDSGHYNREGYKIAAQRIKDMLEEFYFNKGE